MKYSFNICPASYSELLKYVSEEEIYCHYYGDFKLDTFLPCPFRHEKRNSFIITVHKNHLKWIRYGFIDRLSSALDLVKIKYNLGYLDAIIKIYNDIYVNKLVSEPIYIKRKEKKISKQFCKYTESWNSEELQYWKQFEIEREHLSKFKIYPCLEYFINGRLLAKSSPGNPAFVYLHSETSWTLYRPYAKPENKFRKYNINRTIMGIDMIPHSGKILFITSSYKDIIVLSLLNFPAIAPHGERAMLEENIIKDLKTRYEKIVILYDSDLTGIQQAQLLSSLYQIPYIFLEKQDENSPKDPAEYIQKFGKEKLLSTINFLINIIK